MRCRLVAQEFAGSDKREGLYAGTLPLSATRYVLSDRVSRGNRRTQRRKLMVVDIKRGPLHGMCTKSIYFELPAGQSERGAYVGARPSLVWDARCLLAWQKVVKGYMRALAFQECKVTTGVFTHRVIDLIVGRSRGRFPGTWRNRTPGAAQGGDAKQVRADVSSRRLGGRRREGTQLPR